MGPPEIFAVYCTAFVIIGSVIGSSMIRGLISTMLGILLSLIGLDPISSMPRLTFDVNYLETGIGLVPVLLGVFVVSEIFVQIADRGALGAERMLSKKSDKPEDNHVTWREFRGSVPVMAKSTGMGTIIGMLPGVGASAACFVAYAEAKRAAKPEDKWGHGEVKGVAAAEAANNSVSGANLIPLLTLGIPGSISAALVISALMIQGIQPGPLLFEQQGRLIYGLFGAMIMANVVNFWMGQLGLRFWARVVSAPETVVFPAALLLSTVGVYTSTGDLLGVFIMLIFAGLGYLMTSAGYSVVVFIIAFFLGPRFERSLSQTLNIIDGNPVELLGHPVGLALLLLAVAAAYWMGVRQRRARRAVRDPAP